MLEKIEKLFIYMNLDRNYTDIVSKITLFIFAIILGLLLFYIFKKIIIRFVKKITKKTKATWDDYLIESKLFENINLLIPVLFMNIVIPITFENQAKWLSFLSKLTEISLLVIGILILNSLINFFYRYYQDLEISKSIHIKGLVQIVKVLIVFTSTIFAIAIILNKSAMNLFIGLGSITAILLLIFKDALLGFVAGIQIAANKMVIIDDWIEMPKFGADGEVIDIALTTVKVRNWDKTITTIPTYAMISEPFKNWRGMQESDGRRIKRSLYIDVSSIAFLSDEQIKEFMKIRHLANYLETKYREISDFNSQVPLEIAVIVNKRILTNIGTFRAYIYEYLKKHPLINSHMTLIVRQLELTPHGLPLEIYCFSKDKTWENYERLQSDIFDHLLSISNEFHLKIFQNPSSSDFKILLKGV